MADIFAGFDILGLGTLIGAVLFLGGLILVLWDNRSFEEVNRRHAAADQARRERRGEAVPGTSPAAPPAGTEGGSPGRPSRPKRAA